MTTNAARHISAAMLGIVLLCSGCSAVFPDREALEEQQFEAQQSQAADESAMEQDPAGMSLYWAYMASMLGLIGYQAASGR